MNKTAAIISKRTRPPPTDNPIIKGKLDFGSGFIAHFFVSGLQYKDVQSSSPSHGSSLSNLESSPKSPPPKSPPELAAIHLPDVHIKPPEHCSFVLQGLAVGLASHCLVTDEHFNEPHSESFVHDFEDPFLIIDIAF